MNVAIIDYGAGNIQSIRFALERLGISAKDIIMSGLSVSENREKKIICPFHNDSHPSMSWFEEGNTFVCMVCREKGLDSSRRQKKQNYRCSYRSSINSIFSIQIF